MFSWLFSLFRRRTFTEDAERAYRYAQKSIVKHVPSLESPSFQRHLQVFADGVTKDGVPWAWIHGIRAGGWIEINPPHRIFIAVDRGRYKRWVQEHEEGHHHFGGGTGNWHHDPRFDRYFRGWAETRRSLGYALADFARHPIAGQTGLRAVELEGLLIDEIVEPEDQV